MIKNQKQANLTKEKLKALLLQREEFESSFNEKSPAEILMGKNSFDALINDLSTELREYEELSQGNLHIIGAKNLDNISDILIGARIAQKVTHRELGDRVGIQEQQIQRYEATDYESASLSRIQEIASALHLKCFFEKIILICNKPLFELPNNMSREEVIKTQSNIKERGALICIE